jgi:hypothetical protein
MNPVGKSVSETRLAVIAGGSLITIRQFEKYVLMRSKILQRFLTGQQGECSHVPAEQRDVGHQEGQDEGAQGEVGHLLQHLVEVADGNGSGLKRTTGISVPSGREGRNV